MKKKIIIGLGIFSLIFLLGGIYIITTIEKATSKLDNLITLHQVEILREHLLIQLNRVQADIHLKDTPYARNVNTVAANVTNMVATVKTCFNCHHDEGLQHKLEELRNDVNDYKKAISHVVIAFDGTKILHEEEDRAFSIGENLISKVNNMITMSSAKLAEKTRFSLNEINNTKIMLYIVVSVIPLFAAGMGFAFIRGFTKPVDVLVKAARRLENGDLDYRIEGLKSEFGEVATAFNDMSDYLQGYMHTIRESEKRYRTLFESAGDAIFILEAEGENTGKIISANKAAAEMHGYEISQILKLNLINDIDSPEAAKEAPGRIRNILNGKWINAEITHQKKDGTFFPVAISAGLLQYMEHKYILIFARDISERKKIEESLQRAEQMKVVGEWATGLAHEIKNSLAGIKVSVEVLMEELDIPEEDRMFILKASEEVNKIETLLRSLLNFAKPPAPCLSVTDINDILDKTLSLSLGKRSHSSDISSSIHVITDYDQSLPQTMADPVQLQQVFLNLLFNAREAMQEGGDLSVRTLYDKETDSIHLELSDTGQGIDKEMENRIFQPFFTTKSKGTGLGLSISKKLIEQHGGDIFTRGNPKGGTVFHIILPIRKGKKEVMQ
jgi:two-component system sensor histidine kinase AtoS